MNGEPSQQTQPCTQQILDPRRLGRNNSGLDDGDVADVLAILHPATPTAIKIVEQAAETRPQHVLFRNTLDSVSHESLSDIEEQETIIISPSGDRLGRTSRVGADLALRMSSASKLRYKQLGFVFGRNANNSDIIFGNDAGKRISNQHFRIFMNADGILLLQDMSTNGTIVDDRLLRCKDKRFDDRRMLTGGSIICIQNANESEMIKFVVRIPSRVSHMDRFADNLRRYIMECVVNADQDQVFRRVTGGSTMKWDGGDKYNIIGNVGKGAFATVYQLATKMTGKLLAAKELEKRRFMKNGQLDKKLDNEMRIMEGLRHENIVEFVEHHDSGDHLYIIMEYVRHGDLQGFLNQGGPMKENLVRQMGQQVLSALNYLHRSKITHRDIKPDNILIADLEPFKVKLSDFGLSKVVQHDETFLKTFCGTLLYCAPEVFPDYGHGTSKGTKRRRGTKHYHSYSSSVDIWSFGGVLWYSLCGEPPFKGIADNTGEAMYRNIMATSLDPSPLRRVGISEPCIDLLMRMLRTDPAERPTGRDCLNHPWLNEGATLPADPTLQSIVEEDESEGAQQQLSQLSIHKEFSELDDEDILSDEELLGLVESRGPKRVRADPMYPRNQHRNQYDSSENPSLVSEQLIDDDESFKAMPMPARQRLFGEIGQSALQSSGVLQSRVNNALSDNGGSAVATRGADVVSPTRQPPNTQLDTVFSSPSLLGAESLVRELNMASPRSPVSRTQSPVMPATPRTPEIPQHNSLNQSSKELSQISEPTPKARVPGINRQMQLPLTASYYYDPSDPSTHNLEYASKVSGFDFVTANKATSSSGPTYEDTLAPSDTSGYFTTSNPPAAASSPTPPDAATSSPPPHPPTTSTTDNPPPALIPTIPAELDIKPPPRRLGKLTATPDSFAPHLVLTLDQSKTSWGRHPHNTIPFPDTRDTRIPKTAFVIFWYSSAPSPPSTVEQLSQQGKDWTALTDLHVGICTGATHGIWVNGKLLRQRDEKGRAIFGHLQTGDVVQVYADVKGGEWLRFECEFYLGNGRERRGDRGGFEIRTGVKWDE